ncbi:Coenzyme PQQ synthesis protein D [Fundidesulfovibrio magnetotacticus]|uniref:Coenzyme PQQ synthesis protein D n=2 Tax=Fundidesulfovibrio magnetotacticus TaxID=2730080 RepID=A0A6V8LXY6_9BACT|nr:Coenzyme PQQ synthesis protein D [Fundidesulfovibrio magnetotacticus]
MRPARNRMVREERLEGGLARLTYLSAYRPWFAGLARRMGAWDGRPLQKKLELDELGTFCWDLIDGERTVKDMALALGERYGVPAREAELSVAAFLRELGRRGLIGVRE